MKGVSLRKYVERVIAENDRRYSEVSAQREKAIEIKERAEQKALELAREIQTYKDEKANELREQINSERGLYATKDELRTIQDWMAGQQGRSGGMSGLWGFAVGAAILLSSIASVIAIMRGH
jgi:Flp pilus assembly protein TadB